MERTLQYSSVSTYLNKGACFFAHLKLMKKLKGEDEDEDQWPPVSVFFRSPQANDEEGPITYFSFCIFVVCFQIFVTCTFLLDNYFHKAKSCMYISLLFIAMKSINILK